MSGHNKWSKIKHKKAVSDAQKSKVFSKLVRLITVESKKADGNVNSPGLRLAIEKAKKENMPSNNIERAVKKGSADGESTMESVTYETYGPGGVAVIIEGLTDNKNRTAAEIKHLLKEYGLELAGQGSVTWSFDNTAGGWVPKTNVKISVEDGEKLQIILEELEEHDDVQDVYVNAE